MIQNKSKTSIRQKRTKIFLFSMNNGKKKKAHHEGKSNPLENQKRINMYLKP